MPSFKRNPHYGPVQRGDQIALTAIATRRVEVKVSSVALTAQSHTHIEEVKVSSVLGSNRDGISSLIFSILFMSHKFQCMHLKFLHKAEREILIYTSIFRYNESKAERVRCCCTVGAQALCLLSSRVSGSSSRTQLVGLLTNASTAQLVARKQSNVSITKCDNIFRNESNL